MRSEQKAAKSVSRKFRKNTICKRETTMSGLTFGAKKMKRKSKEKEKKGKLFANKFAKSTICRTRQ